MNRQSRPQGQGGSGYPSSPRSSLKCTDCGGTGHLASTCWAKILCTECGRIGHPGDRCTRKCGECGKVHERGQCEARGAILDVKRMLEDLKIELRAASRPPPAEQQTLMKNQDHQTSN